MIIRGAAKFCSPISQNFENRNIVTAKEGRYLVIENIRCRNRNPGRINFGKCHRGISVNDSLLIDAADSLQIADIKCILADEIPRMLRFNLVRM